MMRSSSGLHSHSLRLAKQDSINSLQTKLRQQFRQSMIPCSTLNSVGPCRAVIQFGCWCHEASKANRPMLRLTLLEYCSATQLCISCVLHCWLQLWSISDCLSNQCLRLFMQNLHDCVSSYKEAACNRQSLLTISLLCLIHQTGMHNPD